MQKISNYKSSDNLQMELVLPDSLYYLFALFKSGRSREAEIQLRQILEKNKRRSDAWYLLGLFQIDLGKIDEAIATFSKSVSIENKNLFACFNLGFSYFQKKNFKLAMKWMQHVVQLNPHFVKGWINLGASQAELGLLDESLI